MVANGVWSVWDGYGFLFTLVSWEGNAGVLSVLIIPVLALFHPGDGLFTIPEGF